MIWKNRLNKFGLRDSVISFLILLALVANVSELASIGMFLPVFQMASQGSEEPFTSSENTIVNDFMQSYNLSFSLGELLFVMFLLFFTSKLIKYLIDKINAYYFGVMTKNMRVKLLKQYLNADALFYDKMDIAAFTNSSTVELPSAVNGVMVPIKLITTAIASCVTVVFLFILSYELTLASIVISLVVILLPLRWVKATTQAGKKNSSYNKTITSFLLGRLRSPRLVRLAGTANAEMKYYEKISEKQRSLTLAIHLLKARVNLSIEPMIVGVSLLMLYYSLSILNLDIEIVILYLVVMVKMVPVVTTLLTQKQSINRSEGPILAVENLMASMHKYTYDNLIADFDRNIDIEERINKIVQIELIGVCYRYVDMTNDILHDVNLQFKAPSLNAVVGPSGSGKSTLIDIISCYRSPTRGSVLFNGIESNKYKIDELLQLVSYVPQEPQLFEGTISSHISYGCPSASKADMYQAAKLSGALSFIEKLDDGFDSMILEDASNLSGGQKQRLDLARALLSDSPMIILDEPTGNLDLITEKKFLNTLDKIRRETDKIVIMIAHRLNTTVNADQVIVLENGAVTSVGHHSELIVNNKWYADAMTDNSKPNI